MNKDFNKNKNPKDDVLITINGKVDGKNFHFTYRYQHKGGVLTFENKFFDITAYFEHDDPRAFYVDAIQNYLTAKTRREKWIAATKVRSEVELVFKNCDAYPNFKKIKVIMRSLRLLTREDQDKGGKRAFKRWIQKQTND